MPSIFKSIYYNILIHKVFYKTEGNIIFYSRNKINWHISSLFN